MTTTVFTPDTARHAEAEAIATVADKYERLMQAAVKAHSEDGYCYVYRQFETSTQLQKKAAKQAVRRMRSKGFFVHTADIIQFDNDGASFTTYYLWWGSALAYVAFRIKRLWWRIT